MSTTKPIWFKGWIEPESEASLENPPQYPYNHATQTESGHLFELDDTPGRERVRLQHRSGTFTEIHSNADEVHKIFGDGYEIVLKNKNVLINGHCNITINGDATVNIQGDKIERISGDYIQHVEGDYTQVVEGKSNILCQSDMRIGADTGFTGELTLIAGDHVEVSSDLQVKQNLTATKIYSKSSVDAASGMSAGLEGFATTGGIMSGFTVGAAKIASPGVLVVEGGIMVVPGASALPGTIFASGSITSLISVIAPLGEFIDMNAVWMTDVINTAIQNRHIHPTPKGPSGPPIPFGLIGF